MAKRRRKSATIVGRDEYFITGPDGRTRARYAADRLALVEAQNLAMADGDPATFTVTRRSLVGVGPEVELYRVVRPKQEDGAPLIQTFILSRED